MYLLLVFAYFNDSTEPYPVLGLFIAYNVYASAITLCICYNVSIFILFYDLAEIGGEYVSVKSAGNLSTLFDVGGIVGGILAGYMSDKLNARAITAASFMYAAIPSMLLYRTYGSISKTVNIVLMMTAGLFINGPYALITTAVSADLGTHSSLRGDSRALATVTAIIDGTGSMGAALGPLLTGFISTQGWDAVFVMLMIGALIAGLLLSRLVIAELSEKTCKPMSQSSGQQSIGGNIVIPLPHSLPHHSSPLLSFFLSLTGSSALLFLIVYLEKCVQTKTLPPPPLQKKVKKKKRNEKKRE